MLVTPSRMPQAEDGVERGGQARQRHGDLRGDPGGGEDGLRRVHLRGQRHVVLSAGDRPHVAQGGPGHLGEALDLPVGRGRIRGQQADRQVALQRHRRQALAEQVMQVAGHPEPLPGEGVLGQLGAGREQAPEDADQPGRPVQRTAAHDQHGDVVEAEQHRLRVGKAGLVGIGRVADGVPGDRRGRDQRGQPPGQQHDRGADHEPLHRDDPVGPAGEEPSGRQVRQHDQRSRRSAARRAAGRPARPRGCAAAAARRPPRRPPRSAPASRPPGRGGG